MNWVVRNWLILVVSLATLSALGSFLEGAGYYRTSTLVLTVGWGGAGALAVVDGVRRLLGRPSLLGVEQGPGRLLAVIQILLGVLLLNSVLTTVLYPP